MQYFGIKDVALFDIWSIIHLLSGISIGFLLIILAKKCNLDPKKRILFSVITILTIAYAWETVEYLGEIGLFGPAIADWFYGVEFLPNRLLIDPITFLVGYFIAFKKPRLGIPSLMLSFPWLLINIFIFPNVIYFQSIILK